MNMLEKIRSQLEYLSKSERKVTEVILASPDSAIRSSVATLAPEVNVNEPAVDRFCHNMSARGFPGFRPHLAQSLASDTLYVNRDINEDDSAESYTGKVFESVMATSDYVRHSLDKFTINHAVDLLTQAKEIAPFGLGSSAAVAHDTMDKFFRFSVPVVYPGDIVLQRMSYMNCSNGGVVVLTSRTGRTENLVEPAQLACGSNAMVIALTSAGTPFTRGATLAATPDVPKGIGICTSTVSRPAQLTVVDVLATGFTLRRDTRLRNSLKRVKGTLKGSRFDKQLPNLGDDC